MRLKKPCEHGRYEEHPIYLHPQDRIVHCPGGEFLAETNLIIDLDSADQVAAGWKVLDGLMESFGIWRRNDG